MDKNLTYTLISLAELELSETSSIIFPFVHRQQQCSFCSAPAAWSVLPAVRGRAVAPGDSPPCHGAAAGVSEGESV